MSKTKFTLKNVLSTVAGIVIGIFISSALGLGHLLANLYTKVFGEPNWVNNAIVFLITISVIYFIYRRFSRAS